MRKTASKQARWHRAMILTAAVGCAAWSAVATASGCGAEEIILNPYNCPPEGESHEAGDGSGGSGGMVSPYCD